MTHPASAIPYTASSAHPAASLKSNLDAAAWVLERLALDAGETAERLRIRRTLEEASVSATGDPDVEWWQWLAMAGRSLGLRTKIVDATVDQLQELVLDGARVLLRVGAKDEWLAVLAVEGRRYHVLRAGHDRSEDRVSVSELRRLVGEAAVGTTVRSLVIEPASAVYGRHGMEHAATPLSRLWGILAPEWPDIWVVLVFAAVNGLLALASPLAVETLVNTVAFGRFLQPIVILAVMLLAFLAFSSAITALQTYVVEVIQRRLFARVAADLAFRLPRAQTATLEQHAPRELVNRFFDIVTVQKSCAKLLVEGVSLVLGTLIGMAVLAFYHPWLLGFDVVLLALITFVVFVLGRGAVYTSIKESKAKYKVAAWLEDLAACPTAFRYDAAADFALERADNIAHEYLTARKAHFRVLMRQIVFALGMQALASTVLLGLGGWLVVTGQLTLGQLVAAELIVTVIVGSFAKLGKHLETYYDLLAAVDKLGVLFDLPTEREDGLLTLPMNGPAAVLLRQVTYTPAAGVSQLDHLDLEIPAGERLVLRGPSGSGKSLLLDLLFGLRLPTAGHVTLDGVDLRDVQPDALRRRVALVRDVEAFGGTVAENVHLERTAVTINDVRGALEAVDLLDDVLRLPKGLDTKLQEGGFPLTTNQSRRLMLARAIAGQPGLLLIDGTLDALPAADVRRLTTMLADVDRPWTLVIVTGRDLAEGVMTRTETLEVAPIVSGESQHGR